MLNTDLHNPNMKVSGAIPMTKQQFQNNLRNSDKRLDRKLLSAIYHSVKDNPIQMDTEQYGNEHSNSSSKFIPQRMCLFGLTVFGQITGLFDAETFMAKSTSSTNCKDAIWCHMASILGCSHYDFTTNGRPFDAEYLSRCDQILLCIGDLSPFIRSRIVCVPL